MPTLTEIDKKNITDDWEIVRVEIKRFSRALYDDLAVHEPDASRMFKCDMTKLEGGFYQFIQFLVDHVQLQGVVRYELLNIFEQHRCKGLSAENLHRFVDCLMRVFREVIGEDFDASHEASWRTLLGMGDPALA